MVRLLAKKFVTRSHPLELQDNIIIDNPAIPPRDLLGPMITIGSKIYSLGESPNDKSIFAVYELDTSKLQCNRQCVIH